VDFAALKAEIKQEIKNSLLEEFNAILHQEIAAMHSKLQSFMSASHQQPSTEQLPDPKTVLNAVIKEVLTDLRAEFNTTFDQLYESIRLLHQQIQVHGQAATTKQKSSKGK